MKKVEKKEELKMGIKMSGRRKWNNSHYCERSSV